MTVEVKEPLKVGVAGVRGVVGASMTPRVAASFAQAFGVFLGRGAVVVGRDTRPSGVMFERAVVAGLQSVGARPLMVGVAPTPSLLMAVPTAGARGGIAITASHNGAEWNAMKFIDRDGLFLSPARADELLDLYHQRDFPLVAEPDLQPERPMEGVVEKHLTRVLNYVDAAAIRRRRFRVAVDACNGAGAPWIEVFLRDGLGCETVVIHGEPTGIFEREPEPLPAHLTALGRAVVEHRCNIGFAQDPDADRLAIVDECGRPIGEDYTLVFAVAQVLSAHSLGPVVVNLTASRAVDEIARAAGCPCIRTRVGEIHVSAAMVHHGAVVGGEHNGGVIVPAIHPCRDSFTGMALVLERMAATEKRVSEMRAEIPGYHVAKIKIPMALSETVAALRRLRKRYVDRHPILLDGIFLDLGESWVHIRRSMTEPVLRITAEALTPEEAEALVERFRTEIMVGPQPNGNV